MMLVALSALMAMTREDYAKDWTKVVDAIRTRYYAREQKKAQMNAILDRYATQAKGATSHQEFADLMNRMIGDFRDSHFAFLTDADQGFYLMDALANAKDPMKMPEFGAWFSHDPDGYTVRMVLDDSEAQHVGLRKGDVVTEADGKPFSPIDALRPLVGNSVTIKWLRRGATMSGQVKIGSEPCLDMFLDATRASVRVIDDHGRKIGYVHLWTQASEDFKRTLASAVVGKLSKTDACILDIRDGFGGRPEGYADPFFRPDVWIDWKSTPNLGYQELFGYGRPLVLLTNGGSRSAKEVLSFVLKKSRRATLVGQTTAGNVLGTFPLKVNDWSYLEIPMIDVITDGVRLEGNGVKPDIELPAEFDSEGRDLDLAAGLEKLANVPLYKAPK